MSPQIKSMTELYWNDTSITRMRMELEEKRRECVELEQRLVKLWCEISSRERILQLGMWKREVLEETQAHADTPCGCSMYGSK